MIASKRTSLMHTTSERNIHDRRQDKVIYFKVWKVGHSSGSVFLDMTSESESPVQLMSLITKQYSSRIAVATTKEDRWKIAKINSDPSNSANNRTLKDGITFDKDQVQTMLCRALDSTIPLARLGLSNFSFLKEDTPEEQLKRAWDPIAKSSNKEYNEKYLPTLIWV